MSLNSLLVLIDEISLVVAIIFLVVAIASKNRISFVVQVGLDNLVNATGVRSSISKTLRCLFDIFK